MPFTHGPTLRPWSVDSLDGGFFTSPSHTVGRSKKKKKLNDNFFPHVRVLVGREGEKRKEKGKETRKKEGTDRLVFKGFMECLNLLHKNGRIN